MLKCPFSVSLLSIPITSLVCLWFVRKGFNAVYNLQSTRSVGVIVNKSGTSLITRFDPPPGFERKPQKPNSFAAYLRSLPLKPYGEKVRYYNGETKNDYAYEAVVDMDISNRDLQQCADAVMRLRGEYFFQQKQFDKIEFQFTNGFNASYEEWIKGNRIVVSGNHVSWSKTASASNTYQDFRNFMEVVFAYAGTLSLSKTLKHKELSSISIGDVFIVGGSPGHAVIVVDVAENKKGNKVFMLAQSYMPAQETQILRNLSSPEISPWYDSDIKGELITPEWTFYTTQLKTWY